MVAVDGFGSSFLWELAKRSAMPAGYKPIGLDVYSGGGRADPIDERTWVIGLLAVDASVAGGTGEELARYARNGRNGRGLSVRDRDHVRGAPPVREGAALSVALDRLLAHKPVKVLNNR